MKVKTMLITLLFSWSALADISLAQNDEFKGSDFSEIKFVTESGEELSQKEDKDMKDYIAILEYYAKNKNNKEAQKALEQIREKSIVTIKQINDEKILKSLEDKLIDTDMGWADYGFFSGVIGAMSGIGVMVYGARKNLKFRGNKPLTIGAAISVAGIVVMEIFRDKYRNRARILAKESTQE